MLCPLISFTGETICWKYFNKMFLNKYLYSNKYGYHQTDVFYITFTKEKEINISKYLFNM